MNVKRFQLVFSISVSVSRMCFLAVLHHRLTRVVVLPFVFISSD